MDKEQIEQESGPVAPPLQWGKKLREVREERRVSLREIATELHLDVAILEALESEDLDKLPGASFVKGYLRSYARLLDLPADELVQAYDCAHGDDAPCLHRIGKVQQMTSKDAGPRYATWGVVAVVVISVLVWWSSKILSNGVTERDSADVNASAPALPSAKQDAAASVEADVEVDGESVSVAPLLVPQQQRSAPVTPKPVAEPAEKVAPAVSEAVASAPPKPSAPAPEVTVADADLSVLTLDFSEDVWVEITDGRGKRLFFDLGRKGQVREVKGVKPFKILFGNAPGVTLKVDGNVFDHSSYQRRNGSAKFKLGD